ncbi:hypothetical protein DPMN_020080 [Dreissena polymorpha]|uniref:Uncharacterized protein n=1 Tax=Dreissena polymorpha TaxID=45954 RepID=A0A9D4NG57_DREPO|nr:hypothetical protein DPMN_020080 [Dreissena polymorpha]
MSEFTPEACPGMYHECSKRSRYCLCTGYPTFYCFDILSGVQQRELIVSFNITFAITPRVLNTCSYSGSQAELTQARVWITQQGHCSC